MDHLHHNLIGEEEKLLLPHSFTISILVHLIIIYQARWHGRRRNIFDVVDAKSA